MAFLFILGLLKMKAAYLWSLTEDRRPKTENRI